MSPQIPRQLSNRLRGNNHTGLRFHRGACVFPRALSLIEVVASLVIVGFATSTLLTVHARSVANVQLVKLQTKAHSLAEGLLAEWSGDESDASTVQQGNFPEAPRWRWSRTSKQVQVSRAVRGTVVELKLVHSSDGDRPPWTRVYRWLEPEGNSP